jgi:hypothetical protein
MPRCCRDTEAYEDTHTDLMRMNAHPACVQTTSLLNQLLLRIENASASDKLCLLGQLLVDA